MFFVSLAFVFFLNLVQIKMLQEIHNVRVNKLIYLSISIALIIVAWLSGDDLIVAMSIGANFLALFGIAIFSVIKSNALIQVHISSFRNRIIQSQNNILTEPNSYTTIINPVFQTYVILLCLYNVFFVKDNIDTMIADSNSISLQATIILFCLYLSVLYLILNSKMMLAKVLESKSKKNHSAIKIKIAIICISALIFYFIAKKLINPTFFINLFDYKNITLSFNNLAFNFLVYLLLQLFYFATNPFAFSVQTICKAVILYQNIFTSIFVTLVVCGPLLGISKLLGLETNTSPFFLLGFNITLLMTEYFMRKNIDKPNN